VFFDNFGDSSLDFTIAVWTDSYIDKPGQLKSQLYFEIFKQFAENGIEIPFPQRDIHIKTPSLAKKLIGE
jgi:small-conductance mechanosensitive channel